METHLHGLDQWAEKRDVVFNGVGVDNISEQYCRVDTPVHLQVLFKRYAHVLDMRCFLEGSGV